MIQKGGIICQIGTEQGPWEKGRKQAGKKEPASKYFFCRGVFFPPQNFLGGAIMPGRNGTGPANSGPMTGRGFGPCGKGTGFERGCGFGQRGCGNGFGRRAWAAGPLELSKEEKARILKAERDRIEQALKELGE
jgi:hypothetical protein